MLYELIQEVTRWKKEVSKGNLSPKSIQRIKNEGVAKTPEEYATGLRKGSMNIVKQAGLKFNDAPMKIFGGQGVKDNLLGAMTGGAYTSFGDKVVRSPKKMGLLHKAITPLNNGDKIEQELITRHEANEAKYGNQNIKNGHEIGENPIPLAKVGIDGKLKGQHFSMKVIGDEAADVNFYNNLFGSAKNLKRMRGAVEDKILKDKLGVSYNDINFENKKNINRKIGKYENNVVFPEFMNRVEELPFLPSRQTLMKFHKTPYDSWSVNTDGSATKEYNNAVRKNYVDKFTGLFRR